MALTDRAAANKLAAARIASNIDVAAAQAVADQCDQRHMTMQFQVVVTALTAAATYRFYGFVADRAYKVIAARYVGPAAITANASNYLTVNVVANNDQGGADTTLATLAISTTSTVASQSTALTVQSTNTIAANQQVDLVLGFNASGAAVPGNIAPYVVDLVVQEV